MLTLALHLPTLAHLTCLPDHLTVAAPRITTTTDSAPSSHTQLATQSPRSALSTAEKPLACNLHAVNEAYQKPFPTILIAGPVPDSGRLHHPPQPPPLCPLYSPLSEEFPTQPASRRTARAPTQTIRGMPTGRPRPLGTQAPIGLRPQAHSQIKMLSMASRNRHQPRAGQVLIPTDTV
jgi:hypothetical protein